jgi:hypothetical protein
MKIGSKSFLAMKLGSRLRVNVPSSCGRIKIWKGLEVPCYLILQEKIKILDCGETNVDVDYIVRIF